MDIFYYIQLAVLLMQVLVLLALLLVLNKFIRLVFRFKDLTKNLEHKLKVHQDH